MLYYIRISLGGHFRAGRALYLLTVVGVAVGVAAVVAIQLINVSTLGAFQGTMNAISGQANLTILGVTNTIDERLLVSTLKTAGVTRAVPIVRGTVILDADPAVRLDLVGVDLLSQTPFAIPNAQGGPVDVLGESYQTIITETFSRDADLAVGDSMRVRITGETFTLHVAAIMDLRRDNPSANSRLVVMDIASAQDLLRRRGLLTQIDVTTGEPGDIVTQRLTEELGPSVRIVTPDQRLSEASGLIQSFQLNLTALSFISLFVGAFLVFASTRSSLVRRRAEFGVLRVLGASRSQVMVVILADMVVLGALGVMIGLPLGYVAATTNIDLVSATLTSLYLLEAIERVETPWWIYPLASLVGIGGAFVGAIGPAFDISRRDPRRLLAAYTLHANAQSGAPVLAALACLTCVAVTIWLATTGHTWKPAGFVLAAVLVLCLPAVAPLSTLHATRRFTMNRWGFRYAMKTLSAQVSTTSIASAALGVAVCMLVGITLMIGSFRQTLSTWMETAVRADIFIAGPAGASINDTTGITETTIDELRSDPRVVAVDRLRGLQGFTGSRRINIVGVDFRVAQSADRYALLEGDHATFVQATLGGRALISEPLSRKEQLHVDDTIALRTPHGVMTVPIAGVYADYSTEIGVVTLHYETLSSMFGPGGFNNLAVYAAPAADVIELQIDLADRFQHQPFVFRSNRRLRAEALRIFDQTFAVTKLLQGVSLAVGAIGITLTLLVLARERVSELALYRALGATRRQIFRLFVGKGFGIALIGIVLGSIIGAALGIVLIFVVNPAFFGWTIHLHVPWLALGFQYLTIFLAVGFASVYPAFRASRVPATELSREDV